jgi:hypothetical protein
MFTQDAKAAAALSFFFSELTYVEQEVLKQPYPEIKYPKIIHVDTTAPPYADSIAFKTLDFAGEPALLGSKAGDIPLIEIASSKGSVTVHTYAEGFDYTIIELGKAQELARNSRSAGINLLAEKPAALRQSFEQFLDKAYFLGDARTADVKTGLLNDPDVTVATTDTFLPDGAGAMTLDEILDDEYLTVEEKSRHLESLFNKMILQVFATQTKGIYRPSHILLPLTQYGKLLTFRIPNTTDTLISYLERVLKIKFEDLLHLSGIGANGTDRCMVYTYDPKFTKAHMPMPFNLQAPATADNVKFVSAALVRCAGTEIRIPKQHLYVDGI